LYAYLQDDVARKRPSVDLVVSLLRCGQHDRWRALRHFSAQAPLRRHGLVQVVVDRYSPSGSTALADLLQVAPRFVGHLLGDDQFDETLTGYARRHPPEPCASPADPDGVLERRLAAVAAGRPPEAAMLIYI